VQVRLGWPGCKFVLFSRAFLRFPFLCRQESKNGKTVQARTSEERKLCRQDWDGPAVSSSSSLGPSAASRSCAGKRAKNGKTVQARTSEERKLCR